MQFPSRMKKAAAIVALSGAMSNAYALPYQKADISPLTRRVSLEDIGPVLGDHEDARTVYIMPGTLKFKGKLAHINGTMNCQDLYRLRLITYRMPSPEELQRVIERGDFFSPAFESRMGVAARNNNYLTKIRQQEYLVSKFIEEHKEEYGTYIASKTALDLAEQDLKSAQQDITSLNESLTTKIAMATTEEERERVRADYRVAIIPLLKKRSAVQEEVISKRETFIPALRDWAPYKDQLEWLEKVKTSLKQSYASLLETANESMRASENLILALESKIVGLASGSYSINLGEQAAKLNQRIMDAGLNYHAQPLPIFNVRLNPGVVKRFEHTSDQTAGLDYELVTYSLPAHTMRMVKGQPRPLEMPATLEHEGKSERMKFYVADFDGSFAGSQSFEMPVTQGAVCGHPISKDVHYRYTDQNGVEHSRTTTETSYASPAPNQKVFVQNVAVRYNYYKKAEPISGRCEMDVHKTSSYVRNAGYERHWSWFKVHTRTWDDTRQDYNNNMGIYCQLTKRPQGNNAAESAEMNKAFEKALYQDIFNMFIMTYAKDYTVTPVKPELLTSDSRFFSTIGDGVMNLCGSNVFCSIGGIILKSLDDLVGARHTGTTSNSTTVNGKLIRDLKLDNYIVDEAFSDMEISVCMDDKQCEV